MRRREFISGLFAITTLQGARAQQSVVHRIAIITAAVPVTDLADTSSLRHWRSFFQQLHQLGYAEGRNIKIERYSGEGRTEYYAELARAVVRSRPDLIFAPTNVWVQHLKAATTAIPIVSIMGDPVGFGLVASLAHPGGNITGLSVDAGPQIASKFLELLKEVFPSATTIGVVGRRWPGNPYGKWLQEAAQRLGLSLLDLRLEGTFQEPEYRHLFEEMAREHVDALYVTQDPENVANRRLIVELAEKKRLPAIYPFRDYVTNGGLMAYAVDLGDLYARAAGYIDKILKGTPPGEFPIYQAAKYELIVNPKAANAIRLTIPPSLVLRADEVIE
jgi:putative tryptophan/tyrosine transport system substrate-binding protein